MNTKQEAALEAELDKAGLSKTNKKATKEMLEHINSLHQGDKLFLRNQLGMKLDEADEFNAAIALWKKRGGGMTEWSFVMAMTDEAIASELGFEEDDDETDAK